MNRVALMTGILSLTLAGVAAEAQTQSQQRYYPTQPQAQTVPGSSYEATQQRSQNQPGQQPKLYQHQNQPTAVTTAPAPASGMGKIGEVTGATQPYQGGATQPYQGGAPQAYQGAPVQAQPGMAPASQRDLTMEIQNELTLAGFQPGPIDGIAGPKTKRAIRGFQSANGMPQDGAPSGELLNQMRAKRMQAAAPAQQPVLQPVAQSQPQPMPQQTAAPAPVKAESEDSGFMGGLFTGWFKRMDNESAVNKEVQAGYQPKFYKENTASQESQGPGITRPWPEPARDPAALNQIAPAAGKPIQ